MSDSLRIRKRNPCRDYYERMRFQGEFRDYQQRILDKAPEYFKDGHIHVVAPPGSGKTILGLELICRRHAPAVVFSPTVAIAAQWLDRLTGNFDAEPADCSSDLERPATLTSVTYQALHAVTKQAETDESAKKSGAQKPQTRQSSSGEGKSQTDALTALADRLIAAGVRTICLDEAHHLRREWQKVLERFVALMRERTPKLVIIALTATPPYDADPNEWQRYITLCGDIDEEIFTPELVAQHNLCPHQDYVMFNYPTDAEMAVLREYQVKAATAIKDVLGSDLFAELLREAGLIVAEPATNSKRRSVPEAIYEHPDDYLALMVLMTASGLTPPDYLIRLVTVKRRLPAYRIVYAEQAFQFVISSPQIFGEERSSRLKSLLARRGLTSKGRVELQRSDALSRALMASSGKLDSIACIADHESKSMGDGLRMLVLTDYIRKEQINDIGTNATLTSMGVVPVFETIRRACACGDIAQPLAAVSGSLVIIPTALQDEAYRLAEVRGATARFTALEHTDDWVQADFGSGTRDTIAIITALFEAGRIRILVGTKSLLGEGWDSPSINTLVLASFVGSFMLTNQMRGRAIRAVAGQPGKVANIWHLVAAEPETVYSSELTRTIGEFIDKPDYSQIHGIDYATLRRRFDCFIGPSYLNRGVESGIERLGIIKPPFDRDGLARINADMLRRAADRDAVAQQWRDATADGGQVHKAMRVDAVTMPRGLMMVNLVELLVLVGIAALTRYVLMPVAWAIMSEERVTGTVVTLVCVGAVLPFAARAVMRLFGVATPKRQLFSLGEALLGALKEMGRITSPDAHMVVEQLDDNGIILQCTLTGATHREQAVFAETLEQLLEPIDNPRYVIIAREWAIRRYAFSFACPAVFARNKTSVACLAKHLASSMGRFDLVSTRDEQGRRIMLKCRTQSFINRGHPQTATVDTLM